MCTGRELIIFELGNGSTGKCGVICKAGRKKGVAMPIRCNLYLRRGVAGYLEGLKN